MGMDRILGQRRAIETLSAAYRSGRLHHAWIFAGPRGVGKFTTAAAFAKVLLDPEAGRNLETAPASETARLIESGAHPDHHVIRKEDASYSDNPRLRERKLLNIPVDLLRERLIGGLTGDGRVHDAPAYRTPVLGHAKVFIIDEAELIDRVGQNSLLKTLEEPPPRTHLFLVTSRPQRLLPTIHSRCQRVAFGLLDEAAMNTWFDATALNLDAEQRPWVERFAEGSPGRAQLAVEYGFHEWRLTLTPMLADLERDRFPIEMGQTLAGLVDDFANAWVKQHDNASKTAANQDGARYLLSMLAAYARRRLGGLGRDDDPTRWLTIIDLLRGAEGQLLSNVNVKLLMENLAVQWANQTAQPA